VKEALLSQWIDALSLDDEDERLLKGVESLKNQEVDDVRQKLHRLTIEYQREKEKVKQDVRTQLIKALRKEGISGSAVEPKIEGTDRLEKELKKLDHHYRVKLEEIKDQLRGL
jgi:Spy/CpxP family protein refolding chaperone